MFYGEHEHTLDDKCRFTVPAKFRERLKDGCFMTRGLDGCLWIFTASSYEDLTTKLQRLDQLNPNARNLIRFFTGHDLTLDQQGRLLIPPALRAHANVNPKADVVIVGVSGQLPRIELWQADRWASQTEMFQTDGTAIAESLYTAGITLS
ncbi:MAG: division/cell wall cluster transcriptional repressor MraZ [Anaerolineae bacterium]